MGCYFDEGTDGYEIFIFRDGDGNGRVSMMDVCPNCSIKGTSIGWVRKFKCKERLSSSSPPRAYYLCRRMVMCVYTPNCIFKTHESIFHSFSRGAMFVGIRRLVYFLLLNFIGKYGLAHPPSFIRWSVGRTHRPLSPPRLLPRRNRRRLCCPSSFSSSSRAFSPTTVDYWRRHPPRMRTTISRTD